MNDARRTAANLWGKVEQRFEITSEDISCIGNLLLFIRKMHIRATKPFKATTLQATATVEAYI